MSKELPKLRGLVDAKAEQEITRCFNNIYNYIDEQIKAANISNPAIASEVRRQLSLFSGNLAAPLVEPEGSELATASQESAIEVADVPNLPANKITSGTFPLARIPTNVLKTSDGLTEDVLGAPNVNTGKVNLEDNNGNIITVMTCAP